MVVLNIEEREIKKLKTKKKLFISAIVIVLSVVILNFISFIIS